ncbi:hypothetical protein Y032_0053g2364 [Ancylostoma ceylanicum]|uniref:Uncharacterized protein n=1 Tax=Ancylostoma ceylanicum TaxID=53326 RepID=A0A016U7K1_9BILA|nr:hypothetical protein Y032_0053g2364 [Ancylostoma ceylanicum]
MELRYWVCLNWSRNWHRPMRRDLRNKLTLLRLLVPDSELEIAWEALPAVSSDCDHCLSKLNFLVFRADPTFQARTCLVGVSIDHIR